MLFKLSLQNIKKSVKDYAVYFFTLIIGVSIFYIFNSIESQTAMLKLSETSYEVLKVLFQSINVLSIFVSFVLGFLIIYASRFLMKRRNKEFGLYLLLGMGKRKVSLILFLETLFIGIISLGVGIVLGMFLSQFMSVIVANMFKADMTDYHFTFSGYACTQTIKYFAVIYIVVILFNTIIINRYKLIDLLQAGKKNEKIRLKNPVVCSVICLASMAVIGYCYYKACGGFETIKSIGEFGMILVIGIIATFFLFWSVSGLMLRIVMSIKGLYLRGLNAFALRQISSKINSAVFSMTIIAIMLMVTICMLSSGFSINESLNDDIEKATPAEIEITQFEHGYDNDQKAIENANKSISEVMKKQNINLDDYLRECVNYHEYMTEDLTVKEAYGRAYKQGDEEFFGGNTCQIIMKVGDYNKIAKMYGREEYNIEKNQYIILADYEYSVKKLDAALKFNNKINVFGQELTPKFSKCQKYSVDLGSNNANQGIFLVSDEIVDESAATLENLIGNYKMTSKKEIDDFENKITKMFKKKTLSDYVVKTKRQIEDASVGIGVFVTFIGIYLGFVFLISGAAILALKELSESADNVVRYQMLQKLGVEEKMIKKSLFMQIGFFFFLPLIVAVVHSTAGMVFCNYMLESMSTKSGLNPMLYTALIILIVYGGYFVITYFSSKAIIKEKL